MHHRSIRLVATTTLVAAGLGAMAASAFADTLTITARPNAQVGRSTVVTAASRVTQNASMSTYANDPTLSGPCPATDAAEGMILGTHNLQLLSFGITPPGQTFMTPASGRGTSASGYGFIPSMAGTYHLCGYLTEGNVYSPTTFTGQLLVHVKRAKKKCRRGKKRNKHGKCVKKH